MNLVLSSKGVRVPALLGRDSVCECISEAYQDECQSGTCGFDRSVVAGDGSSGLSWALRLVGSLLRFRERRERRHLLKGMVKVAKWVGGGREKMGYTVSKTGPGQFQGVSKVMNQSWMMLLDILKVEWLKGC